ncbi:MAG TPA: peptidoglycan-binding domain-containing protein [Beijerinckiaceae bacterium]|nr:peptidoglycan-binding domain-containing protein [Beijerinckiaceae bacterium]
MREALAARSGRDFMTTGAAPLAGSGKRFAVRLGSALKAALLFAVRRPALVLGTLVVLAACAAVALNALAWQTTRHPAPLFPRAEPALRRPVLVPAPLPPARPPEVAIPAAPAPAAVASPAAKPASRDPIGDLIRGVDPASVAKDASAKVAAAQRALTKLGYGTLKSDGAIGPGTRQAIEKFERDRRLPVTGDLNSRTTRELSAQAGMPIE